MTSFFHVGTGPFYIKALALRGTLYTLISKVDEAVHDLTQVINAADNNVSTKVDMQPDRSPVTLFGNEVIVMNMSVFHTSSCLPIMPYAAL